jgi:hypothetical protein
MNISDKDKSKATEEALHERALEISSRVQDKLCKHTFIHLQENLIL